jgi:hypothetical protein
VNCFRVQIAGGHFRQLSGEDQLILARDMPRSLLEAALHLSGDVFAPAELQDSLKVLREALSQSNMTMLEHEINSKYFG